MTQPQSDNSSSNSPSGEPPFLDVPALLESSQPAPRVSWFWYSVGLFLLLVLISAWASRQSAAMANAVRLFSAFSMIGIIIGLTLITWFTVRRAREEQLQLEAVEELVSLRRWPQAGLLLEHMLSQPTRTPAGRIQALLYLTTVLARYHRFDDAIAIHDHVLETVNLDPASAHAVRLGRAMAMLREDRLVDADRAIAELRRSLRAARSAAAAAEEERRAAREQPSTDEQRDDSANEDDDDSDLAPALAVPDSAGLALIEIYRDVKTGHPDEAIQLFAAKLDALRNQLGNRVADAWALAAKAYDLLGRSDDAQDAYAKATLLAPVTELNRRYPEIATLAQKYRIAPAPAEML
jgi:tetratricopeptide (TPR) repeat protein